VCAETHYQGQDLEALSDLPNYHAWILDDFAPYLRGRSVEIGAGVGTIARKIARLVDSLEVIEPANNLHDALERTLAGSGVTIHQGSVEDWLTTTQPGSWDSIVMVNVLEHIADDQKALDELRPMLRPGGHLLLFVPALPSLFSRMDAVLGHYRRYGLTELKAKTAKSGFTVQLAGYRDILGVPAWGLVHRLMGRTTFDRQAVQFYDRFGVPATRRLERLGRAPFGKNILLVARAEG
jgi:SAM-dependent methyltransferase